MTSSQRDGAQGAFLSASIVIACAAIAAPGLALAAKPGGGGGGGTTWNVRLHGVGDSIIMGYNADCTGNTSFADLFCYSGGDQPEHSYFDGTSAAVVSLADKFILAGATTTYSKAAAKSGSEMVGGTNNFRTQATTVVNSLRRQPVQVKVELGGNDICNRTSTTTMYNNDIWRAAVRAGLDVLTQRLPDGSSVVLVGVPRVQDLRQAGVDKTNNSNGRVDCPSFWSSYDVCEIATAGGTFNGESLEARHAAIAERQVAYNAILREQAALYNQNAKSTGVEVVVESDGVTTTSTEVGAYAFSAAEINGGDCFHPSILGQNNLATIIFTNDRYSTRP